MSPRLVCLGVVLCAFVGTWSIQVPAVLGQRSRSTSVIPRAKSLLSIAQQVTSELHQAVTAGDTDMVKALLSNGANANAANEDGLAPLHAACLSQELHVAEVLLSQGADAEAQSNAGTPILIAARQGDSKMISALLKCGADMDQETTDAAFFAAVEAVETMGEDEMLSVDVPRLLHHVFNADMEHLLRRSKVVHNVTCMQPAKKGVEHVSASLAYIFDCDAHANLPLREGRKCENGRCCDACSRVEFPTFATLSETDYANIPGLDEFSFDRVPWMNKRTTLIFTRLLERIRRTIAHEYGLPLSTILPLQAYSRTAEAGTTSVGGGNGQGGDGLPLHTDEATHACYHYSCVLYLSSQGEDFEGGSFHWVDSAEGEDASSPSITEAEEQRSVNAGAASTNKKITSYAPRRGSAIIFSSGWENMHEVAPMTSGRRSVLPAFFTTEPVPPEQLDFLGGMPEDDVGRADELDALLLGPLPQDVTVTPRLVKELMMKWHGLMAPGYA